jgi:hypothetical protein
MATQQTRRRLAPVQIAAYVVGVAFLVPGVLGFVPGITTHYDMLDFAGHESGAKLLGIFGISVLHNIVHLAFGVAGLVFARTVSGARGYLLGSGVIYLLLSIYGVLIDQESAANFVPIDAADNWLHLVLAVGMLGLGVVLGRRRTSA